MRKFLLCRVCQIPLTDTKIKTAFCCDEHRKSWTKKYKHEHYLLNKERLLKQNREWREKNKEKRREQNRLAQQKSRDKLRGVVTSPATPPSSEGERNPNEAL